MTDVEVTEKDNLLLEVEVYAVPEPKIVWFKDGNEVRSDARIKIQRDSQRLETYNLTLNLIKREEAGVYEMKASNTLGTAVSKSVVTVNSKLFSKIHIHINVSNCDLEQQYICDSVSLFNCVYECLFPISMFFSM